MDIFTIQNVSKCINLTLCQNIGYHHMRLPNLLGHDTINETIQQSKPLISLLNAECHPDTKMFLCSLFSPVCLDRKIYPCQSFCNAVKASCELTLPGNNFSWPDYLRCDRFPDNSDLCILQIHNVTITNGKTGGRPKPTSQSPVQKPIKDNKKQKLSLKNLSKTQPSITSNLRKRKKDIKDFGTSKRRIRFGHLKEKILSLKNEKLQEELKKIREERELIRAQKSYYELKFEILANSNPEVAVQMLKNNEI